MDNLRLKQLELTKKIKFKLYKPVDEKSIYKIINYCRSNSHHTLLDVFGNLSRVNLHRHFEFENGYELIGKKVKMKIKNFKNKNKNAK